MNNEAFKMTLDVIRASTSEAIASRDSKTFIAACERIKLARNELIAAGRNEEADAILQSECKSRVTVIGSNHSSYKDKTP